MTEAEKFYKEKAKQKDLSADQFLKEKRDQKDKELKDRMAKLKNRSLPEIAKDVLVDSAKETISPLAQLSLAPLSAAYNLWDLGATGVNALTNKAFGKKYLPTDTSKTIENIREEFPISIPKNTAQDLAFKVGEALSPMGVVGKGLQGVAKGINTVGKHIPGVRRATQGLKNSLEGAHLYNAPNIYGTAGATILPELVDNDNTSGRLAASLAGSLSGSKLGASKTLNPSRPTIPKTSLQEEGLPVSLGDIVNNRLMKPLFKTVDEYSGKIPYLGRSAMVKEGQKTGLQKKLKVNTLTYNPDVEGKNFYEAASKAVPKIEEASAKRVNELSKLDKKVGKVELQNLNDMYKSILKSAGEHPGTLTEVKKDPVINYLNKMLKPWAKNSDMVEGIAKINKGELPIEAVKTSEKLLNTNSPFYKEALRNIGLDKDAAALKNLTKDDYSRFMHLKDQATNYFKNVEEHIGKIKGLNKEEQYLLGNTLFEDAPEKTYPLIKAIRSNIDEKSLPQFTELVTKSLGTDPKTYEFSLSNFASKFKKMPQEMKEAFFGQKADYIVDAVKIVNKLGSKLDKKEAETFVFKLIKMASHAALPIKGLDILNTSKPLINWVNKRQFLKQSPQAKEHLDTFIKSLAIGSNPVNISRNIKEKN